jgi:large subunit ribosomal protein L24
MASHKIKKDDMVKVISGKSRGKTGRVLRVDRGGDRVYVEGLNIQKRHQRSQTLRDTQRSSELGGGIIEKPGPIHISNVMLVDPAKNKPTRVGIRREDGKRVRYSKLSGEAID